MEDRDAKYPQITANYYHKYSSQLGLEKDSEILDAFAGTGLVARQASRIIRMIVGCNRSDFVCIWHFFG